METLNVRLLAILLAVSLVVGPGVYVLHEFQVRRNAGVFLLEAERARERDDLNEAAKHLNWYINLRPDDTEVLEELGLLLADIAESPRALTSVYGILERVLRQDDGRDEARRKLVEVAIKLRRYRDAREHLEGYLLKQSPEDGELWEMLGRCQSGAGEDAAAMESFQTAIKNAPEGLEAYDRLARLLRGRMKRTDEADDWMRKVIEANPDSCRARVLLGNYLLATGSVDEAAVEAATALKLEPDDRDALWLSARCATRQEEYDDAREYANRAIELYPDYFMLYATLADIEMRSGQRDEAIAVLERGLKATDDHQQLLWRLAQMLIEIGRVDEAGKTVEKLVEAQVRPSMIGYLRARIKYVQRDWRGSVEGLEAIRGELTAWPYLLKQADYFLGLSYGRLGNTEQQLAALRRAIDIDTFFIPARAALARALFQDGQFDAAEEEYRSLTKMDAAPGGSKLRLARLLVLRNLNEPSRRDWPEVNKLLDEAAADDPRSPQIPLLKAEIMVAQDRTQQAEELLTLARNESPETAEFWGMLVSLAQRREDSEKAEQLLEQAQKKLGDSPAARLLRARYLVQRQGQQAKEKLRELAEKTAEFSDEDRLQLFNGLLNTTLQVGDSEQTERLCRRVAEMDPNNLQVRFLLFELAVGSKDQARMEETLKEIRRVEGEGPYWSYAQAVQLTMRAGQDNKLLNEALTYLGQAREQRPRWSRVPLLEAGIYDQQGKLDLALKTYLEAIEMGELNLRAFRRAVRLLKQNARFPEADKLVRRLAGRKTPLSPDIVRDAAEISLNLEDFDRALSMAEKTATDSDDYREHLWLGQVLGVVGLRARTEGQTTKAEQTLARAEKSLRRAVELSDQTGETWVALVQFLSRTEQAEAAEKAIENARKKLSRKEAPLALARCYQIVEQMEKAERSYKEALAAAPDDPVIVRYLTDFYLGAGKLVPAEAQLKRIIAGKVKAKQPDVIWARRRLAFIVATRRDPKNRDKNRQKAIDLLEKNLAEAGASAQDQRLFSRIRADDPRSSRRQEAIETLQKLLAGEAATPEDRFLLFQLHLRQGEWVKASRQMIRLLTSYPDEPRYRTAYVNALLDHNEIRSAELYLRGLEKTAPNRFSTVALQAELLFRRNKLDQLFDLLTGFVDRPEATPSDRITRVGLIAGTLEKYAQRMESSERGALAGRFAREAETLYRQYVGQRKGGELMLAEFLARRGEVEESLQMLERNWSSAHVGRVARVAILLMKSPAASRIQIQRTEDVVQAALKKSDRPVSLLLLLADVRTNQQRYREAETFYREVLKKNSGNAVAMNNLAVLLALQKIKLKNSLKLINDAIEIAGPLAPMLDSRASVYLAMGEPHKALADLKEAIAETPTSVRYFHQAQAYYQAGRKQSAAQALEDARKRGLTPEILQPLERPMLQKLQEDLQ